MAEVLHTILTGAWSRKRRLLATAISVILGVAFLMGTLVIGTSARAGFETAFGDANAGTDALVRSADQLDAGEQPLSRPFDEAVAQTILSVEGVTKVEPVVDGVAQIMTADGELLGGNGPPTLGAAWIEDPALTGYELAEGRAPAAPGEVVVDKKSATDGDLAVGDVVTILTPDRVEATVVGIATFGDEDSLGGTTLAAFALPEAQRVLLGGPGQVTGVVVGAAEGIDQAQLIQRLEPALPADLEAITGDDLTEEQQEAIESDFLGVFVTGLLAFAGIALLVAAFSIFNTFTILAAQRTRESALLRTLGASRAQVLIAGVAEAAVVGVLGAALGVAGGIGLAQALLALLGSAGMGLPVDGITVNGSHLAVAAGVGVVVTIAGGLAPAWRAARVAPLAALREVAIDGTGSSRLRAAAGAALAAAGGALVIAAGNGDGAVGLAGLGTLLLLVALILLGPVAARVACSVVGAPLRLRGTTGELARRNAMRNPRRTSATATALLIGVGVVSLFTVFGASLRASLDDAVSRAFRGDLVVESAGFSGSGLSPALREELASLDEIEVAAGMGWGPARIEGDDMEVGFGDMADLAEVASFDVATGSMADVGDRHLAVSTETAETEGWAVGDTLTVELPDGATEQLEVAATYDDEALGGDVLVPTEVWSRHARQSSYVLLLMGLADGTSVEDGRTAAQEVVDAHGGASVQDREGYVEAEAGEVDALLNIVYGLLGVAILIALMGIANTISLSVHERTRELGLLRAVGQTRQQLRAMVRWESALVAAFGALGGIGLGLFAGWGLVRAIAASEGFATFALPVTPLLVVLFVGAGAGIVAGIRPARRAARLDVLDAVAAD